MTALDCSARLKNHAPHGRNTTIHEHPPIGWRLCSTGSHDASRKRRRRLLCGRCSPRDRTPWRRYTQPRPRAPARPPTTAPPAARRPGRARSRSVTVVALVSAAIHQRLLWWALRGRRQRSSLCSARWPGGDGGRRDASLPADRELLGGAPVGHHPTLHVRGGGGLGLWRTNARWRGVNKSHLGGSAWWNDLFRGFIFDTTRSGAAVAL